MAMHILTLKIYIHDVGPAMFFIKVLSNELSTFVMLIVYCIFVCHIVNTHSRPLRHLHNVDSKVRSLRNICYLYFLIKNVNADQLETRNVKTNQQDTVGQFV
jgi:hypothetical protein